jgi:transposase InsO family protein
MPKIGTRKLYYLLEDKLKQIKVGRDMLFRILKANHMLIKPKRQYHITTNSHHRFRKHKNLIGEIVPIKPEQIWVSDITYVGNRKNPMYLALVTDTYSKKIVGYDVSNSLCVTGSANALRRATKSRVYKNNPIVHHSDRGLQYCSDEYQAILKKSKIKCSMTESYDPYENAVAERVNSIQIYNDVRPHYSCYYKTPNQMHKQKEIKIRTYKSKNHSKNILTVVF